MPLVRVTDKTFSPPTEADLVDEILMWLRATSDGGRLILDYEERRDGSGPKVKMTTLRDRDK